VGSAIARDTDFGIYLHAGPEIGVASTKAFTSQMVALALFTLHMGRRRHLSVVQGREMVEALLRLPDQVEEVLALNDQVRALAEEYVECRNFLYLGRGYQFPVALEGALKLKEVSYIHAEGYPAAEMKHGPIALIDDALPVVAICADDHVYEKMLSNIQEVKARGGRVIAIAASGNGELRALLDGPGDVVLEIPPCPALWSPFLTVLPLQLLAYHVALRAGRDVDQPRNLAKSVTVE
jgi:glucosamine--fructose-6-phosphate aminotransferase (isomerizing)